MRSLYSAIVKIELVQADQHPPFRGAGISRSYSPHFLFTWPSSRVSVMGGDQLQSVMETVSSKRTKEEEENTMKLKSQIEKESEAIFGTARL